MTDFGDMFHTIDTWFLAYNQWLDNHIKIILLVLLISFLLLVYFIAKVEKVSYFQALKMCWDEFCSGFKQGTKDYFKPITFWFRKK